MTDKMKFAKSVSFNKKNVEDLAILKHISRRNFSGYVKKLILADMAQKGKTAANIPAVEVGEITKKQLTNKEKLELLKQKQQQSAPPLIKKPNQ